MVKGPLLFGVGINDADYVIIKQKKLEDGSGKRVTTWACPYHVKWTSMIRRCYSKFAHKSHPSTKGNTVSEEWHTFSNFREWMVEEEFKLGSLKGLQLDKDLLVKGNTVYSSKNCVFIHSKINSFINERKNKNNDLPCGVYWK